MTDKKIDKILDWYNNMVNTENDFATVDDVEKIEASVYNILKREVKLTYYKIKGKRFVYFVNNELNEFFSDIIGCKNVNIIGG